MFLTGFEVIYHCFVFSFILKCHFDKSVFSSFYVSSVDDKLLHVKFIAFSLVLNLLRDWSSLTTHCFEHIWKITSLKFTILLWTPITLLTGRKILQFHQFSIKSINNLNIVDIFLLLVVFYMTRSKICRIILDKFENFSINTLKPYFIVFVLKLNSICNFPS